jgi:hypothetical protein
MTMKHYMLFLFIFFTGIAVNAQHSGGLFFTGGTLGFSREVNKSESGSSTVKNSINTSYNFLPTAGIFLGERFALGVRVGYTGSVYKIPEPVINQYESTISNLFSMGPFFRYYVLSGKGGIFAEASFTAGFGNITLHYYEADDLDRKGNITKISVCVSPGIYYYITPKIAIEAGIGCLGYENSTLRYNDLFEPDTRYTNNNFRFEINPFSFSVGAIVLL